MTRTILFGIALMLAAAPDIAAQDTAGHDMATVKNAAMERNGNLLTVSMDVTPAELGIKSNRAVLITPVIKKGNDSLQLASVGLYGNRRYYFYVRDGRSMLSDGEETTYRMADAPDTVNYTTTVPFERWMNGSKLYVRRRDYGCCHTLLAESARTEIKRFPAQPDYWEELPPFAYIRPQAETVKTRELSGSAFIDFPVNKTVILPDYRKNTAELGKIMGTIDSVRGDRDYTITSLSIKGYASPEGSYANNDRLAKGRTQALKDYVCRLQHFDAKTISTSHEAEDWAGLHRFVEKTNLKNKAGILSIIDGTLPYDAREQRIKALYPDDYAFIKDHCYPALRHSDYLIEYTVRQFSDVDEIKRLIKSQPSKLSLEEFYLAAQTYEPGSDGFNEIFETAVRMYPDDPTANLNAAYTAIGRRDLKRAGECLAKAGNSPQAIYARGVHALLSGNDAEARGMLEEARRQGVTEASEALKLIEENIL